MWTPFGRAERKDAWIPWSFIGFFAVVLLVNGIMIFVAFDTWTGIGQENANSYQQGLAYNDRLAEVAAQEALGWQAELSFEELAGRQGRLELALADRNGNPLEGAAVAATLARPTNAASDFALPLSDAGIGRYGADIDFPAAGQWDVRIVAEHGDGTYRITGRVYLSPESDER
jgi:nitrogen fixation protein FixH